MEEVPNAEMPSGPGSPCPSPRAAGAGETGADLGHEALVIPQVRAEIVACVTCGGAAREPDGRTRGEHLIERLDRERAARGDIGVDVQPVRCLWACKRSCAVLLRSPGRPGYVIVELEPSDSSARALLDYAGLYLRAPDGAVPYKTWPEALRGHFHCRIPAQQAPEAQAPEAPSSDALPDTLPPEVALHDAAGPLTEPAGSAPRALQDPSS
jgi:predicted metal-binding protein